MGEVGGRGRQCKELSGLLDLCHHPRAIWAALETPGEMDTWRCCCSHPCACSWRSKPLVPVCSKTWLHGDAPRSTLNPRLFGQLLVMSRLADLVPLLVASVNANTDQSTVPKQSQQPGCRAVALTQVRAELSSGRWDCATAGCLG